MTVRQKCITLEHALETRQPNAIRVMPICRDITLPQNGGEQIQTHTKLMQTHTDAHKAMQRTYQLGHNHIHSYKLIF